MVFVVQAPKSPSSNPSTLRPNPQRIFKYDVTTRNRARTSRRDGAIDAQHRARNSSELPQPQGFSVVPRRLMFLVVAYHTCFEATCCAISRWARDNQPPSERLASCVFMAVIKQQPKIRGQSASEGFLHDRQVGLACHLTPHVGKTALLRTLHRGNNSGVYPNCNVQNVGNRGTSNNDS